MQQAKRRRRGEQLVPDLIENVMRFYCDNVTVDQIARTERVSKHVQCCIHRSLSKQHKIEMRANINRPSCLGPSANCSSLTVNGALASSMEQATECLRYCLQRLGTIEQLELNTAQLNVDITTLMQMLLESDRLQLTHIDICNVFDSTDVPLLTEVIRRHCATLEVIGKISLDVAATAIGGQLRARRVTLVECPGGDQLDPVTVLTRRAECIERLANSGARIQKLVYWTEHGVSPTQVPFFRLLNEAGVSSFNLSTIDSQLQLYIPPGNEAQLTTVRNLNVYAGRDFYFNAVDVQFAFPQLQRFSFQCESIETADVANAVQLAVQWLVAFPDKLHGYANSYIKTPISSASMDGIADHLQQLAQSGGEFRIQGCEKISGCSRFLSCMTLTSKSGSFTYRIYGAYPRRYYEDTMQRYVQLKCCTV